MLAPLLGLPRQSEILIIIFLGICFLSLDFSLFQVKSNLEEIWKIELDKSKYLETCVKYIISAVVLVRTFTLHGFLAFYVVMLWPAIFEEKASLMLPWLLLGIIRCLIANGITFVVGTYICQKEKGFSPICFEFILAQMIEHGPSVYAWFSVLSFYRETARASGSQQSSVETLGSDKASSLVLKDSQNIAKEPEESTLNKTKSYSLSDLNLNYLCSNRSRNLPADTSMEVLINELRDLFSKKRIIRDGSKSFDSIIQENASANFEPTSGPGSNLTVQERTMKSLEISEADILHAKKEKDRFAQVLKDISKHDVNEMDKNMSFRSYYSPKGKLITGTKTHIPKSHSEAEDANSHESCLCYLRKQLQLEQSNQTLLESEIANITFNNDVEKDIDIPERNENRQECCTANKAKLYSRTIIKKTDNDLNKYRVVVGSRFGFNPNLFLQKFALKKNTSKNFGCQVSILRRGFLEESRNQLAKKLVFLRNFGLC